MHYWSLKLELHENIFLIFKFFLLLKNFWVTMTYGTLSCIILQIPLLSRITELHYFCYFFCYYCLMIALNLGKLCVHEDLNMWCKIIVQLSGTYEILNLQCSFNLRMHYKSLNRNFSLIRWGEQRWVDYMLKYRMHIFNFWFSR